MTETDILVGSLGGEKKRDWPRYLRFRRPSDLDGVIFGFLFRIISAMLAGGVALLFSLIFGALDGWHVTNTILIFDGLIISSMVFLGEHFRSRVFERVLRDEFFSLEDLDIQNTQLIDSLATDIHEFKDLPDAHAKIFGRESLFRAAGRRLSDILSSLIGLILLFPLFVLIAATIKFSSPGPVFFKQTRYGFGNKKFVLYKFRTMRIDENPTDTRGRLDQRSTAFGRLLRKSSFDELPQLLNVLKGDMTLVGPRPYMRPVHEVIDPRLQDIFFRVATLNDLKPGITGWSQVNAIPRQVGPVDQLLKKKLYDDLYYLRNRSFIFDLKILLLTFYRGFLQSFQ